MTAGLIALVAATVGALGAYLAASRKLSGKIGTSEAGELWTESKAIRDDYRERLVQTDVRTAALEARVANLEKLNNDLTRENLTLSTATAGYEAVIAELRARLDALELENGELRKLVTSLQESLGREHP